ncbi:MAG: universal stress protein [Bacteroidales bacterium]|jgi:nucleotide-binding universal stress UspA family protein|nr:universal stress protein [Bacteroidales bacterium]
MKKTLLAIINDPKEAKGFIQYVASMSVDLKTSVKLLHVLDSRNIPLSTADASGVAAVQLQENLETQASIAKKTLAKHIEDVKGSMSETLFIEYSVKLGITSRFANALISDNKVDMVFLEGGINESFWNQTRSNMAIIEDAKCPVWIVPNACVYKPFNEIIYATDYNEEDVSSLKKLISTTQHYSPNITALHITDSIDFDEKVKKAGFIEVLQESTSYKQISVKVLKENSTSEIAERINDYANIINANLIVILKENKSFFERVFETSQTKSIIKNAMLPIVVFHENK